MSVVFGVPKKLLPYSGLVGAFGWLIYLIIGKPILLQTFFATFIVSLLSHIFARLLKAPGTVFLIPGILPIVPGIGVYRIVYYAIEGETKLSSYYLTQTIQVAGIIALAIFIMDSIFKIIQLRKQ
jgi:uncharacterized membrane protein YjjB (DUF3815 family)